jgi:diguanylate cyclase (GGDEF)-like protein
LSTHAPWIDLLTAAWKCHHFEACLARSVQLAHRQDLPLTLLWVDVDDLHEHNELHGWGSVDAALAWLAQRISVVVDGRGPVGRVRGGAFASYLLGVSRPQAVVLSQHLRREAARTLHSSAFGDYRLTVSVGVVTLRASEPWGNLVEAARSACTRAKQGGRDMVVAR